MNHIAIVSQSLHDAVENVRRILQPKFFRRTRIAEAESWDAWSHDVECLLSASAEAWQTVWVRERIDYAMNLDERAWPRVTEEKRNRILMLGALMDEVDSKRLGSFGGRYSRYLNSGAELRQGSIEMGFLCPPVIML